MTMTVARPSAELPLRLRLSPAKIARGGNSWLTSPPCTAELASPQSHTAEKQEQVKQPPSKEKKEKNTNRKSKKANNQNNKKEKKDMCCGNAVHQKIFRFLFLFSSRSVYSYALLLSFLLSLFSYEFRLLIAHLASVVEQDIFMSIKLYVAQQIMSFDVRVELVDRGNLKKYKFKHSACGRGAGIS